MKRLCVALVVLACVGCGKISNQTVDGSTSGNVALALAQPSGRVPQTGTTTVGFTITRDANTTGALTVQVTGLPAGVTAADVAVAAGVSTGTLTFASDTTSIVGATTAVSVELHEAASTLDHQPFSVFVAGAPGTLDTTFGTAGVVGYPLPDPTGLATPGDGLTRGLAVYPATAGADADKILVAAQLDTTGTASTARKYAVVRFNADGSPDTSFGGGASYVLIDTPSAANVFLPVAIAIDSQLRVVVLSSLEPTSGPCQYVITRLTPTGDADSSFPTVAANPFGFCGDPTDLAILPGDKVFIGNMWNTTPSDRQCAALAQYDSMGVADNTAFRGPFYADEMENPDTTKQTVEPTRFIVDANGNYVLSGRKCDGGYNNDIANCDSIVGRITPTGSWDTTFGSAGAGNLGYSALTFGTSGTSFQDFNSVAIDATGNIVAVGWNQGVANATIARFTPTGAVDTSFATSGRATITLVSGATQQELDEVMIDDQNRIVGFGYVNNGGPLVAVTRYTSSGQVDPTFGSGGVTTVTAGGLSPHGRLQSDGRLVAAGAVPRSGGGANIGVWRFWP